MAFTFSHAVVAPYLYRITHRQLPLIALVIGSMLPDISRVIFPIPMAHHFSGMFSINLLCGGILCFLWYWLYRPTLFAFLHWQLPSPLSRHQYIPFAFLIILSLLLGNFSHLLWDSITHLDDRTWFGHQFLAQPIQIFDLNLAMHQFLQYTSSLIVLPWLYWGFKPEIPSTLTTNQHPKFSIKIAKRHLFFAIVCASCIACLKILLLHHSTTLSNYSLMVQGFKYFCLVIFAYFNLVCLYHYRDLLIKHTN